MTVLQMLNEKDGAQGRSDAFPQHQRDGGVQPSLLTNAILPSPEDEVSNLLAVNVMSWIGERIAAVEAAGELMRAEEFAAIGRAV